MKQTSLQDWYFEKIEESKNIFSIAEALILERGINLEKVYPKELLTHSREVARLSIIAGDIFGIGFQNKIDLAMGALLHDYGKILIDPQILYKQGPLTDTEYMLIQNHPTIGYRLLRKHDFPNTVLNIVLMHHEKIDGSGYPLGEKNPDFLVQIVTVADIFDAIYKERSYHEARSILETIDMISKEDGLNPIIVDRARKTVNTFKE